MSESAKKVDSPLPQATMPVNEQKPTKKNHIKPENMIDMKTSRSVKYYECSIRTCLASGFNNVQLSALGESILTAVQLTHALQRKKVATLSKVTHMFYF